MYQVVTYPGAADQIVALPAHLLGDFAHALDALAASPWDGAAHHRNNRRWLFGPLGVGQVLYLVMERELEIHILWVVWLEFPEG